LPLHPKEANAGVQTVAWRTDMIVHNRFNLNLVGLGGLLARCVRNGVGA
jgi:hypothetical protein